METTDKIFIENNICSIHDAVINKLINLREDLISKNAMKLVPALEDLIQDVRLAKEKGIRIEHRLKTYLYTIRAMGFSRERGGEEITIINNRVVIIPTGDIENKILKPDNVDE